MNQSMEILKPELVKKMAQGGAPPICYAYS
jgi:hypothetical protein